MDGLEVPLPAVQAASSVTAFDAVRVVSGAVWWLESRRSDSGRVALMRLRPGAAAEEVTPPGADVGTDLHGYGGGAYAVEGERVFYVDRTDGCLHILDKQGDRIAIKRRQADEHLGDLTTADGRLWCIRENGHGDELLEVTVGGGWQVLTETDGFLGSPRIAAGKLAWLRWDHDRMPWDGSELFVADRRDGSIEKIERVAGGRDESVTQPQWDDHGQLWFMSDRTGWWNLYRRTSTGVVAVAPVALDCAPPEWEAGYNSFALLPNSSAVMIGHDGPHHQLVVAEVSNMRCIETPYTSYKPYLAVDGDHLYAIAASPILASNVVSIDLTEQAKPKVLAGEAASGLFYKVSKPDAFRCTTADGRVVSALLYPPWGATSSWTAPLIVRAHPGPTSSINSRLDWHLQYLTSNGFAVADVDYCGSSGYGRDFRRRLYGRWGTADVNDCIAVATHLLEAGRTRPGQVFVTGASAGGYTALQAVSRPSVFSGAVARSAIVNPSRWQQVAPRWQRPHAIELSGLAGTVRADRIEQPVLLIHGKDDHVAPLSEVNQLAAALSDRGVAHRLLVVGARHSLSTRQAAAEALEAELKFYRELLPR